MEGRIQYLFRQSGGTYGLLRITQDLWAENWQESVNAVAEITAELGLQGRKPPRRPKSLTRQSKWEAAPDLVHREYTSEESNALRDRLGVVQSMGRMGSALDNAAAA
ncbi:MULTISPECIES: IS3 family transposase [unclassified Streptomyces]|uniref:IS3 family transposase n=1 Tax=unclassified Streptomyces TaxID=2593676 RepID=UPI0037FB47DE